MEQHNKTVAALKTMLQGYAKQDRIDPNHERQLAEAAANFLRLLDGDEGLAVLDQRKQASNRNTPIVTLIREYEKEHCDFNNLASMRINAMRLVETMPDSHARCLLYALASKISDSAVNENAHDQHAAPIAKIAMLGEHFGNGHFQEVDLQIEPGVKLSSGMRLFAAPPQSISLHDHQQAIAEAKRSANAAAINKLLAAIPAAMDEPKETISVDYGDGYCDGQAVGWNEYRDTLIPILQELLQTDKDNNPEKRQWINEDFVAMPKIPTDAILACFLTKEEQEGGPSGGDFAPWSRAMRQYAAAISAAQNKREEGHHG